LTQNIAGPFCTQVLGDLGADIIKLERPGKGDDARAWAPPYWGNDSAAFLNVNRGKRSLAVDLKTPEGKDIVVKLARRADVFIHSLEPAAVSRLGLDAATARALNARLVYCTIGAFGTVGPLTNEPGYDPLMQAYSGLMALNGHPGAPPARVAASIVDMGTALWAVIGILCALQQRASTGTGCTVGTALFETSLVWSSYHIMSYLGSGHVPTPQGSGVSSAAPYEAFPVRDGYVMIAAGNDTLFGRLCEALDVPVLADDARFRDNPSRVRNRADLSDRLSALTRQKMQGELLETLRVANVPCAPILTVDAVVSHPQTLASGMLVPQQRAGQSGYRSIGLPLKWDEQRPTSPRPPPKLGEHTAAVLIELGYSPDEIRRLSVERIIECGPA
jgi:crotonobetainyl-CoA:carnitine CoA-transferase CaiB-like acyl-CoA transferase